MKALLSARDPGAARCLIPLARAWPEAHLLAQSPAYEMLQAAGLQPQRVTAPVLDGPEDPARRALLEWADGTLRDLRPDLLVTGLSGPGLGLDEALLAQARGVRTVSLQDLDGLVVEGFGKPAETYLVSHQRAAEITRRRCPQVHPIAVGSLKHEDYARLDPLALRQAGRAGAQGRLLTFYGQPAWGWPGYARTLEVLAQRRPTGLLRYRPHPKETAEERARALRLLDAVLDPSPSLEESLCATDLLLTVSSSCAIDHLYLQRVSPEPLGSALFLLFEPELQDAFELDVGERQPWQVDAGLILGATTEAEVEGRLAEALEGGSRSWQGAQSLEAPGSAGAVAWRALVSLTAAELDLQSNVEECRRLCEDHPGPHARRGSRGFDDTGPQPEPR